MISAGRREPSQERVRRGPCRRHTVFAVGSPRELFALIDEAWARRKPNDEIRPGQWVIDMGRVIGTNGETKIRIGSAPTRT